MHDLQQTIVAPATGNQATAIGVIRLSGPQTFEIIQNHIDIEVKRGLQYGWFKSKKGDVIDEVVVITFVNPHSYTRQDTAEINCHGSPYIVEEIIHALLESGAVLAHAGEFTYRAFLNGRMDLAQSEAVTDLIMSTNRAQHRLAFQQLKGSVSEDISTMRQELIDFASLIELELDFGEEDVEFADRTQLIAKESGAKNHLQKLIDSFALGNAIKNGIPVSIIGAPNAGKSTLLNALLQEERAIVSEIPGTTRDVIEDTMQIDGVQYRFIDTAGIRKTEDTIEAEGVQRSFASISKSNLVLLLIDAKEDQDRDKFQILNKVKELSDNYILVFNKVDENDRFYFNGYKNEKHKIAISAKEKLNLDQLKSKIKELTINKDLESNETIISNIRHRDAFQKALSDLERVDEGLQQGIPGDLIAMDIRQSLYHIGTITGEISADDLLGNIFSRFCIGK